MKRRRFIQTMAAAPALAIPAAPALAKQPAQGRPPMPEIPRLETSVSDAALVDALALVVLPTPQALPESLMPEPPPSFE